MKLWVVAFTRRGARLCSKIVDSMTELEHECTGFASAAYAGEKLQTIGTSFSEWTNQAFLNVQGIIFVGACGIAVRAIAPYIISKTKDPAVVAVDEHANFAVSLLSGHIGGANALTIELAKRIGATPVVSTATDLNHRFAVDCFAEENNLYLCDMQAAKAVSAALLDDKTVFLQDDFGEFFPQETPLPQGIQFGASGELGICISLDDTQKPFSVTLNLVPKVLTIGIGCRKNTAAEFVEQAVMQILDQNQFSVHAIKKLCSIDLKAQENGILEFCRHHQLQFSTYSAQELEQIQGDFASSDFVKDITGVDNVCERAAVLGSTSGKLIVKKQVFPSVTVAVAIQIGGNKKT
nr:cobalamin biosynthesis protein [uncultured Caproiciproducens sp.]